MVGRPASAAQVGARARGWMLARVGEGDGGKKQGVFGLLWLALAWLLVGRASERDAGSDGGDPSEAQLWIGRSR